MLRKFPHHENDHLIVKLKDIERARGRCELCVMFVLVTSLAGCGGWESQLTVTGEIRRQVAGGGQSLADPVRHHSGRHRELSHNIVSAGN